jgi:rubrerythrin
MTDLINKVLEESELPFDILGLMFSNFKTVSQKQQRPHLENLFSVLSLSFEIQAKNQLREKILKEDQNNILEAVQNKIKIDLQENYPEGLKKSEELKQRGALRALTWGQKVTSIQSSLIKRFIKYGESIIKENETIHICEACGFIIIKDNAPNICPVCKAPSSRFITL